MRLGVVSDGFSEIIERGRVCGSGGDEYLHSLLWVNDENGADGESNALRIDIGDILVI